VGAYRERALDPRRHGAGLCREDGARGSRTHRQLPVADNQFVHQKATSLIVIDPTDYAIAIRQGEAAVLQAKADWQNKQAESERRQKLTDLAVTRGGATDLREQRV